MCIKLMADVLHSHLFNKTKSKSYKLVLIGLANFANRDRDFKGYCYNASLSAIAGVGDNQVRVIKNALSEMGLATFSYTAGKGAATRFQLHYEALQQAIDDAIPQAKKTQISADIKTPSTEGVKDLNPFHRRGETPRESPVNPSSLEGVISKKNYKTGAREDARGIYLSKSAAKPRKKRSASTSRFPMDARATAFALFLDGELGEQWRGTWLTGQQIISNDGRYGLIAKSAFAKSKVEAAMITIRKSDVVDILVEGQDGRAA